MRTGKKLILVLFLFLVYTSAYAFNFEPIIQDFEPSGVNSRRSFQVINSGDEPIAVKVSMVHRNMDQHGNEELLDASELFFVFPRQFVVPAGSTQTVRVQWLGEQKVLIERPFRIIAEQLPIDINQQGSGINILLAYHGSIYVIPETFKYGISVIGVARTFDENGNPQLQLELENTGNTHMLLQDPVITLTRPAPGGKQQQFVLKDEALTGLTNQNLLAGKRRVFTVPWPEGLSIGELNATIEIEPTR